MDNSQIKRIAAAAGVANNQARNASERMYSVAMEIAKATKGNAEQLAAFKKRGIYSFFDEYALVKALKWAQSKIVSNKNVVENFVAEAV